MPKEASANPDTLAQPDFRKLLILLNIFIGTFIEKD